MQNQQRQNDLMVSGSSQNQLSQSPNPNDGGSKINRKHRIFDGYGKGASFSPSASKVVSPNPGVFSSKIINPMMGMKSTKVITEPQLMESNRNHMSSYQSNTVNSN